MGGIRMKRSACVRLLLVLALWSVPAQPQLLKLDSADDRKGDTGYVPHWDPVQDRLLAYRDTSDSALATARVFDSSGNSVPLFLLRDFPGAKSLHVWAAAASPDGGAILSVLVTYIDGQMNKTGRSLLLSYDGAGVLRKVWNVDPYIHRQLAVDRDGNVYALGHYISTTKGSYPLLVKYSADGKLLRELLFSSTFPQGDEVVTGGPSTEGTAIVVSGDDLFAYVTATQELFKFSSDGTLEGRTDLEGTLRHFAASRGFNRFDILAWGIRNTSEIVAHVRFIAQPGASHKIQFTMLRIATDGSYVQKIDDPPSAPAFTFLGTNSNGRMVFVERQKDGTHLTSY